jgi:hypothetical protein
VEGERPPLEAVTSKLVKTQQTEKTQLCALVIAECELEIAL